LRCPNTLSIAPNMTGRTQEFNHVLFLMRSQISCWSIVNQFGLHITVEVMATSSRNPTR
jgi:hypothetical protein